MGLRVVNMPFPGSVLFRQTKTKAATMHSQPILYLHTECEKHKSDPNAGYTYTFINQ